MLSEIQIQLGILCFVWQPYLWVREGFDLVHLETKVLKDFKQRWHNLIRILNRSYWLQIERGQVEKQGDKEAITLAT